jgi:hypothetical protein
MRLGDDRTVTSDLGLCSSFSALKHCGERKLLLGFPKQPSARRMTMKLYLKIGLALAIAFVFLMTGKLLTSKAASALTDARLKIEAESRGVTADARITSQGEGTDKAELDVGTIRNSPCAGHRS